MRPEMRSLTKRRNKSNGMDNTADPESDSMWAELDSLELALV